MVASFIRTPHLTLQNLEIIKQKIMKTQNLKKYGFIIVAILFTSASAAQAQRFEQGERPNRPKMEMKQGQKPQAGMEERGPKRPQIPNLTEEQKEQLHSFKLEMDKNALPLKNQVAEKEARLNTLTTADSYDAKAVNKVIEDIGDLKTDLMKLQVGQTEKVKSILTEEQLVAFNSQLAKGPKKGPQMGKGQKGGPRPGQGRGR